MKRCVLYLRSSKDRSDVSIAAQRRDLTALAHARGLSILREYADVVESAKDADRPAFQALIHDLKAKGRGWSAILLLDPSRLSRNQLVAHLFTQDCRRHGVDILYSQMPDASPEVDIILTPMMHALAEYHSYQSKAKGLGGMAENVRRGFRAGGRAPFGYRLERVDTGAVREGQPVLKSRLVPTDDLPKMRAYLASRAAGVPRPFAATLAGIASMSSSTLVCLEWQALTYAGCLVWGQHAERTTGGYVGGRKRKPRAEWMIQPDAHEAVISREQAETILEHLEASPHGKRQTKRTDYLLGGVLVTPEGKTWHGCGGYYRSGYQRGARQILAAKVEGALLERMAEDFAAPAFATRIVAALNRRRAARAAPGATDAEQKELAQVEARIQKLLKLVVEMEEPRALLQEVDKLEARRTVLRRTLDAALHRSRLEESQGALTEPRLRLALGRLRESLTVVDRDQLRSLLARIVARVTLDPDSLVATVAYQLATGDALASPRVDEGNTGDPVLVESRIRLVGRARRAA